MPADIAPSPMTAITLLLLPWRSRAAAMPQRADAVAPAGENLVRISLVADVPDQPVGGRVKDIVKRNGQLDDAKPRTEMAAGPGDGVNRLVAQLVGELPELLGRQILQIARQVDAIEQRRLRHFGHAQLQLVAFTAGKRQVPRSSRMAYTTSTLRGNSASGPYRSIDVEWLAAGRLSAGA